MLNSDQLPDHYLSQLGDLFHSENLLIAGLAKMSSASMSPDIVAAFNDHGDETRMQKRRLFDIINRLDLKPDLLRPAVLSVQSFADDADAVIAHPMAETEREIRLLSIARQIEQHEIKAYLQLQDTARSVGDTDTVEEVQASLAEEQKAEQKVTQLLSENEGGQRHKAFTQVTPGEMLEPDTQYGKNPVAEARGFSEVF